MSSGDSASPAPRAAFYIRNITCPFDGGRSLHIDELAVPQGCMVAIIGKSGAGKSTLLNLLGGLLSNPMMGPDSRLVAITPVDDRADGADICLDLLTPEGRKAIRPRIGFIFQAGHLLRNGTVSANIAAASASTPAALTGGRLKRGLDALELPLAKAANRARCLSGGELQRVAVIRALARNPRIVLADEPTASLDDGLANKVLGQIKEWQAESPKRTVIWATHNLAQAMDWADVVLTVEYGKLDGDTKSWTPSRKAGDGIWPAPRPPHLSDLEDWQEGRAIPTPLLWDLPANIRPAPTPPSATTPWFSRIGSVARLAIAEVFAGRVVDDMTVAVPAWLDRATSLVGSDRRDENQRLISPRFLTGMLSFSKRLDLLFQLLMMLLIAGSIQAGSLLDDVFVRFLRSSSLSHTVVQANRNAGQLTPSVLCMLDEGLRRVGLKPLPGEQLETTACKLSNPQEPPGPQQSFGRWVTRGQSGVYVSRFVGAGGPNADGACDKGDNIVDAYLAVDGHEPMLDELEVDAPGLSCEPNDLHLPLTCLSDPLRARAYVTRNMLVYRLGYGLGEKSPQKFCANINGWMAIEIAKTVKDLPGDSGDRYDFVISHAMHDQASHRGQESFDKAAIYLDMRNFAAFQAFAATFTASNGKPRIVLEEGGDRIKAGIELSQRVKVFVNAALLAFLGISAVASGYTVVGQIRAQRKAVTVLQVFGLSRADLSLYFFIQVLIVQLVALAIFAGLFAVCAALASWPSSMAARLVAAMDLRPWTLVGFGLAVALVPTFVAAALSWVVLWWGERNVSFAEILKQSE